MINKKGLLTGLLLTGLLSGCDGDDNSALAAFLGAIFLGDTEIAGTDEVFSASVDGTTVTKLSGTLVAGGKVRSFQVSPDRRYVAYQADQDVDDVIELYVVRASDGVITKVSGALVMDGDANSSFAWAPDSSRIAYRADQDTDQVFEIYTSTPDGMTNDKVSGTLPLNGDVSGDFAWAPDSSRIGYIADQTTDDVFELYTSTPDGMTNTKVSGTVVAGGNGVNEARLVDSLGISELISD